MMSSCEHNNCVVVHDTRYCPVCELQKEKDELEKDKDKLISDLVDLQDKYSDLEDLVSREAPHLLY